MSYSNTWEPDGLCRKFTGILSGEEILESNFELHVDPRFKDIKFIINDFSEITRHSIDPLHTKIYASTDEIIAGSKGKLKIAIIAVHPDIIALANGYKELMINNTFDSEVFKTIAEAREWVLN